MVTRIVHVFAGGMILISLALAHYHHPNWIWLAAFVGANLLQSGFTNFCPLTHVLRKAGIANSA